MEKTKRAFLGIIYKDVRVFNEEWEKEKIGIPERLDYGAFIVDKNLADELKISFSKEFPDGIVPGSPAAMAGLKVKDVILEIKGEKVINMEEITEKLVVGEKIQVKILREGKEQYIEMTLTEKPANIIY